MVKTVLLVLIFAMVVIMVSQIVTPPTRISFSFAEVTTTLAWEDKPAADVLPGSLKRVFPGQYLENSLNEIKAMLKTASGNEKQVLQKAKKILEQQKRLVEKTKGAKK